MENINKLDLIKNILEDVENDIFDEETIRLLLERKVSRNPQAEENTLGQRAADKLAKFAGSWKFIIIFGTTLLVWICINIFFLTNPFDPYPFILLNLVLSCIAAIQAPVIMMSQNRKEEKDRSRSENDYKVNLKTEFIIEDLYNKIDELIKNQKKIMKTIEQNQDNIAHLEQIEHK